MFTLTDQAHEAVRLLSTSTTGELVPGLRISRRSDRPTFAVKRATAPQEMDHVVEHDGARVFLAPIAALRFADSVLDVRTDQSGRLEFIVRDHDDD